MLCQDLFQIHTYSHLLPVFRGSNSDDHTGSSSGLGSWFTWPSQKILLSQWHLSGLLPLTAAGPHRNYTGLSLQLLLVTVIFLLGPKLLSLFWILLSGKDLKYFGGLFGLVGSVFFEIVFSIFLAPIKMMFHTGFVLSNLVARKLTWGKDSKSYQLGQTLLKHSRNPLRWFTLPWAINKTVKEFRKK